jgi:uncharacterized protein (DUF885 family)
MQRTFKRSAYSSDGRIEHSLLQRFWLVARREEGSIAAALCNLTSNNATSQKRCNPLGKGRFDLRLRCLLVEYRCGYTPSLAPRLKPNRLFANCILSYCLRSNRVKTLNRPAIFLLTLVALVFRTSAGELKRVGAAKDLYSLFEAEWEYTMKETPTFASHLGDRRYNDRWSDVSLAAIERRHQHSQDVLKMLLNIQRVKLSPADQINYDLFEKNIVLANESHRFHSFLIPLNQMEGIQTQDDLSTEIPFDEMKDFEDWITRMTALPVLIDQTMSLMREGISEKIVPPKITMQRVPAQIDKQITSTPEQSPFYKPFKNFPASISNNDRERLSNKARQAVSEKVIPSFQKLKDFFVHDYLPACRDGIGISQVPNGAEYYAFSARKYTTTKLTPEEIHQIGLKEVARIRAEMEQIMAKVGFNGTRQGFFKFLRTDRQFYCTSPEELLTTYRAVAKRIDPELVKIFRVMPRIPYGVIPIPDKIAPDTTTAYYRDPSADGSRAGSYFVNLYKPETRPKWEMMALSLHESVPGHHLQIALAMEQGELPNFRRYGGYEAFVEGWGLYAESLGEDMGLYDDPYSKFGQLTYEMWRAVRLVVDTGMHAFKWDRPRAIDFFLENAAKNELDVVNEIDRYIADPGQALAYKIGELKIKELRTRAVNALGTRFDLKEFHDVVLRSGPIPLDVLESNVDQYVRASRPQKK